MEVRAPRGRDAPDDGEAARHHPTGLVFTGQADILQAIAQGRSLDDILDRLTAAIEATTDGMRASVLKLEQSQLWHGSAPHLPAEYCAAIDGLEIGPSAGSCGTAAFTGELVVVDDVLTDPKWDAFRDLAVTHGFRACWSAPIRASDGTVLGTFALYYDEPRAPADDEVELIETAASIAAIAFERDQLQELRTRQRELEILARHTEKLAGLAHASVIINSQRSVEEMLSSITDQACQIIGAHQGSTSLTEPGTGEAEGWPQLGISVQLSDKYAAWRDYDAPSRGTPSYGLVCADNSTVRMTDDELKSHPAWRNFAQEQGRHPPMRGWLATPLVAADGSNLGILQLSDKFEGDFTEADEAVVVQLAQMASVAVEKAQLHQQTQQHVEQLRSLTRASMVINSPVTLEQMLDAVTRETAAALGVHQAVVSLTDGDDWRQAITAVHLSDKYADWRDFDAPPDGTGIYTIVCESNRTVRMTQQEIESHPAWRGFGAHAAEHPPMRGWLAAPLVSRDGENLGLVQVSDKIDGTEFNDADEALLDQVAQMASVAVEKARLYELAAQQRQTRLREELLSGLSHDMQTPLATIVGLVDVLHGSLPSDDPEQVEVLGALRRQTDHLYVLIQQFLDHLRLQSERGLNLTTRPVDPLGPVQRVMELFEHRRELRVAAPQTVPDVLADPVRLQQVLSNLADNAVKFSSEPVTIVLEVGADDVTIHVDDDGIGLPAQGEPDVVFERFFRGPEASGTPGTGLGLYVTREVVRAMGGEIHASNRDGGGARFSVTLPRVASAR